MYSKSEKPVRFPRSALRAAFLGSLLALSAHAVAAPFSGTVERVKDGDTIRIRLPDGSKDEIRLAGIDAPEKKQPYGRAAGRRLASICLGKEVEGAGRKRDRYKRLVSRITCDGTDPSSALLEDGLAWHYARYAKEQPLAEREADAEAEANARAARAGLWSDPMPEPPWEWRRARKEKQSGTRD